MSFHYAFKSWQFKFRNLSGIQLEQHIIFVRMKMITKINIAGQFQPVNVVRLVMQHFFYYVGNDFYHGVRTVGVRTADFKTL